MPRHTAASLTRLLRAASPAILLAALAAPQHGWAQDKAAPSGTDVTQAAPLEPANAVRGLVITPSLGIDEVLTDNARATASGGNIVSGANGVRTTTAGKRSADLISRFSPSLDVVDRTRRLQFGLNFSPTYDVYAVNSDLDQLNNNLVTTGTAELWPEHLFATANASVSQQIINNQGAITADNRALSINQTEVRTVTLSPTWKQAFGDFAVGQLQYVFGRTDSDAIAPTTSNQFAGALTSGSDFGQLQWGLSAVDTEASQGSTPNAGQLTNGVVNPTTSASTAQRTAQVTLSYALTHNFSLLSGYGYEQIRNNTLTSNISGPFGNIGFGLSGARTNLQLLYNFRYNTQYVSAHGSYEFSPQLKAQVLYDESVTTTQGQLISNTAGLGLTPTGNFVSSSTQLPFNPVTSPLGINSGLGNAISRSRNGQFILSGSFGRNLYTVSLQDVTTSSDTGFNETDIAAGGTYQRDLSPLTRFNSILNYTNIDQRSPQRTTSDVYTFSAGLSYELGPTVTTSATYAFLYRRSSLAGQDIRENSLILSLRKSF